MTSYKWRSVLLFGLIVLGLGCQKKDDHFQNPYAGGRQPLGIHFSTDPPSPEEGGVGSLVSYKLSGAMRYRDSLTFYLNNEKAEVVKIDSDRIQVKVPPTASTGVASLIVGDQIYFGPVFKVDGKVSIDNNFKAVPGANGSVNDALPLADGRFLMVGSFSDFNHLGTVKRINRIVLTSKDGEVQRSLKSGEAVDGYLNSIGQLQDGKLVIAGGFSSYDVHKGEIHNITLLNKNASLDSMVVRTFLDFDTVPAFNGGTDGNITRIFVKGNTITAIGNFTYYLQHVYDQPDHKMEKDSLITDSVEVRNVVRLFSDGSLDSSFNYNFQLHKSNQGPNGPISDAFMQDDGKLIMVGRFTRYDGENVNNIVRLDEHGNIDRTFRVGTGADNSILSIRYNATTHRFILAGLFRHFNGEPHGGLVMLNEDGSVDESFKPAEMGSNDSYLFAQQLSNGLIIVNGYFATYAGIYRGNFMVLDDKGGLAEGYNNTGLFHGIISRCIETRSSAGDMLVMLLGRFDKFDEESLGNIARLVFK